MICRIGDAVYRGRVISITQDIPPAALLDAVTADTAGRPSPVRDDPHIVIDCPPPQRVYEHLGYLHPSMGLQTRTALARAGRTREMQTPYDDELASLRAELASLASEDSSPRQPSERVDEEPSLQSLREDVAAARGRLQACREHDLDTAAARDALETAIRRLSEQRTSVTAVTQQRERLREHTRRQRDRREQTLRLEDRIANLEREARRSLVERLTAEFADVVDRVPGATSFADPFDASPLVAALAIARLASIEAPLVLSCDRFDSAVAAHDWLDAPLIEV